MESLAETNIRAHLERLCLSDSFRASPTLCRVLRFLVDRAFKPDEVPVGQQLIAEQALGAVGDGRSASAVAARMQIGRLRRLLAEYYAGPGQEEPVRIEIPKRNYRLRFQLRDGQGAGLSPRSNDRASLAVVECANLGLPASLAWLPLAVTSDLIRAFDGFCGVAVTGPFSQQPAAATAAGVSGFLLVGDVCADGDRVQVTVRLLEGQGGVQAWATAFSFPLGADAMLPASRLLEIARVADAIADETGVIACRRMQATATAPTESLSVYEAGVAGWRYLLSASPENLQQAARAAESVAEAVDSPTAIAQAAWGQVLLYLASADPRRRFPGSAIESLDRARSRAPTDPWVSLYLAYALWLGREPLGPEAICNQFDGQPGSGGFQGMLGSLLIISDLDPARGEALLADAMRRCPGQVPLFAHALAVCRFRDGDLAGMGDALARSTARTDPLPIVLRMALAVSQGDAGFARRLAGAAQDVLPNCTDSCEVILRRLLHDDHVDAMAATLSPLDLGWFV